VNEPDFEDGCFQNPLFPIFAENEMSLEFAVGDKTRMRTLAGEDAQELFALIDRNRSHLRPWMSWLDATTCVDNVRTFIQSAQDQCSASISLSL